MALFEITKRSEQQNSSLTTPVAAAVVGLAFQESAVAGAAELADGTKPFIGFVTRAVQVGGPTVAQLGFGYLGGGVPPIFPGGIELPFVAGEHASFEMAEEVEVEGSDYIDGTGSDAILGSGQGGTSALGTKISFAAGKFCTALTGQSVWGQIVEHMIPEVQPNVRIRVRSLMAGGFVP